MIDRRFASLLIAVAAPAVARAQPTDPAVARVTAYGAALVAVADKGPALGFKGREAKFLPVVREAYDLEGALALIAGATWASASAADRSAAEDALARLDAARHAENFKAPGLSIRVNPTPKARGADRLVQATLGDETLVYRLRQSGGQWRILDVSARGVSQLALQRSDLASTVAAGGVPALTRKLDELARRAG